MRVAMTPNQIGNYPGGHQMSTYSPTQQPPMQSTGTIDGGSAPLHELPIVGGVFETASDLPVVGGLFGPSSMDKASNMLSSGAKMGEQAMHYGTAMGGQYIEPYYTYGQDMLDMQYGNVMSGMYDLPQVNMPERSYENIGIEGFGGQRVGTAPEITQLSYEDYETSPGAMAMLDASEEATNRLSAAGRLPGGFSGSAAANQLQKGAMDIISQDYQQQNIMNQQLQQQNLDNLLRSEGIDYSRGVTENDIQYMREQGMNENQIQDYLTQYSGNRQRMLDQYGIMQEQAGMGQQAARDLANIYGSYGQGISGLFTDLASAQAGIKGAEAAQNQGLFSDLLSIVGLNL